MISALRKVQTVGFEKLVAAFDCKASISSSQRRMQREKGQSQLAVSGFATKLLPGKPSHFMPEQPIVLPLWFKSKGQSGKT